MRSRYNVEFEYSNIFLASEQYILIRVNYETYNNDENLTRISRYIRDNIVNTRIHAIVFICLDREILFKTLETTDADTTIRFIATRSAEILSRAERSGWHEVSL